MSMERNDYVIVGYDLTGLRESLMTEEWLDNPDNEQYFCKQRKGEIQLFDDPSSSGHLYFGYIINTNDEYEENESRTTIEALQRQKQYVDTKLAQMGFKLPEKELPYQVISFAEYR